MIFFENKNSHYKKNEYEQITFKRIKVLHDGDRNMLKKALN
jgi:hypothetical protein